MTLDSDRGQPAKRNVVRRLEGFLAGLERAGREPNRREVFYAVEALKHLQAGRYLESEESVGKAERIVPLPADLANQVDVPSATVRELRVALQQISIE